MVECAHPLLPQCQLLSPLNCVIRETGSFQVGKALRQQRMQSRGLFCVLASGRVVVNESMPMKSGHRKADRPQEYPLVRSRIPHEMLAPWEQVARYVTWTSRAANDQPSMDLGPLEQKNPKAGEVTDDPVTLGNSMSERKA